jgi:ubiquitin-conjugating enzyme E2 J1
MSESFSSSNPTEQVASVTTIRRINRELSEIQANPPSHWIVSIIGDNILEYHFTIRGPPATEFEGGLYHGRLLLPFNYPFAPPSIMLLNPNGRFEVNKKICLSMSNFHPELWQPAWGIRTMMEALRSFFPTPGDGAIGALDWPVDIRKNLALESRSWTCEICSKRNDEILLHFEENQVPEKSPTNKNIGEEPVPPKVIEPNDDSSPVAVAPVETPAVEPVVPARGSGVYKESNRDLLLNISIFSIIFIIIALIVDIILHPV